MAAPVVVAGASAAGKVAGGKAAAGGAGAGGGGAGAGGGAGGPGKLPQLPQGGGGQDEEPEEGGGGSEQPSASSPTRTIMQGLVALIAVFLLLVLAPIIFITAILRPFSEIELNITPCEGTGRCFARDLPAAASEFLPAYIDAGKVYGVNPYLLLAIHERETNFSRSTARGVQTGVNFAGCCAGPMQFLITGGATPEQGGSGGTWAGYADAYDPLRRSALLGETGKHMARPRHYHGRVESPHPNVYDSYDAIYAAAKYLRAVGANGVLGPETLAAVTQYGGNPRTPQAQEYGSAVLKKAKEYEVAAPHGEERTITRVKWAAARIDAQDWPYCWGGGHGPDAGPSQDPECWDVKQTHRMHTAVGLDCSGAVRFLLVLAGFPDTGPRHSSAFKLPPYLPGPGEHVTIYSSNKHVFVTIDGKEWGTSASLPARGPGYVKRVPQTLGYVMSHPVGL